MAKENNLLLNLANIIAINALRQAWKFKYVGTEENHIERVVRLEDNKGGQKVFAVTICSEGSGDPKKVLTVNYMDLMKLIAAHMSYSAGLDDDALDEIKRHALS